MRKGNQVATGVAIQTPFTFYYVNTDDWSTTHSYQFWNKKFIDAVYMSNEKTLKTIYSPSPSGFVEPKTAAFTGFTSSGATEQISQANVSGNFNNGFNFYTNGWKTGSTIFFAALGSRDIDITRPTGTGNVAFFGTDGCFWSVGTATVIRANSLYFRSDYVYPQDNSCRSFGYPCYSVKE